MYMYTKLWVSLLTAFAIALVATPLSMKVAVKIGAMDVPKDKRRMHKKPTPRFGGMAIYLGTTISLIAYMTFDIRVVGVIIAGTFIYVLGIIDDLYDLPAKVKFLAQSLCAVMAYSFGIRLDFLSRTFENIGGETFSEICAFFITVIWIVALTNTVNLIDGLDGLAAGTSCIAALCIAYVAYIHGMYLVTAAMLAIVGGTLGFLPFNFSPAKTFMGDGGSLFLGFSISTLSLLGSVKGATLAAVLVPILVLALPIFDTAFAILRRLINHKPIMEADRGHLHHRLMDSGLGQRRTVLMLYGISGIMGISAIEISRGLYVESMGCFIVAAIYIYVFITDAKHALPQLKAVNIAEREKAFERDIKRAGKAERIDD
ncbi:MAG: undecaprenyl/decaprenyl-phosphate alpha-N-acetylglucosaminyl 1-phosphate transferase [Clostridia bacterium]|nr:undecaprenyl/decaprenyl-phosphate alpha-N-acetylglucosaminyl 1-phosphate transferase [Clostridia bacterium]